MMNHSWRWHGHGDGMATRTIRAWLICLTPLFFSSVAAQDTAADGWTAELTVQFRRIQGSAMSPDGRHVAYVVSTAQTRRHGF